MKHRKKSTHPNRKTTAREPISKKDRFYVLNRDNFTCRYCGQSAPDVVLHADHVKPVAKGGSNSPDNLVAACSSCNGGKSDTELLPQNNKKWLELNHPPEIINFFSKEHMKQADMFVRLLLQELYSYNCGESAAKFAGTFLEILCARGMNDRFTILAQNILDDICDQAHLKDIEEDE